MIAESVFILLAGPLFCHLRQPSAIKTHAIVVFGIALGNVGSLYYMVSTVKKLNFAHTHASYIIVML
jgi:hypothetical protein